MTGTGNNRSADPVRRSWLLSQGVVCPANPWGSGEPRTNTSLLDRRLRVDSRLLVELVDDVAVAAQGQTGVVAKLAGDVDHAAARVKQQRGERVPEGVRRRVLDAGGLPGTTEGSPAPGLVDRQRPWLPSWAWNTSLFPGAGRRQRSRSSRSGASSLTVRCWWVFVSASSPSESARCTRIVCARTSLQWSASASLGRSPAYASTDRRVNVARRRRGAHRLDRARRQLPHLLPSRPRCATYRPHRVRRDPLASTARCSSVLSRSSACRTATGPAPAASRSACQRAIRSVFSSRRLRPPRLGEMWQSQRFA